LPAAPVRLPRSDQRRPRSRPIRRYGAAAVLPHERRRRARGAVWRSADLGLPRLSRAGLAAGQAAAGGAPGRLSLLVLSADVGAAHGSQSALAALVPLVQRAAVALAGGDRDTGGGEAVTPRTPTRCAPSPAALCTACLPAARRTPGTSRRCWARAH